MPFSDLLREIVDTNHCTGCGACALVCPEQAILFDESVDPYVASDFDSCGPCSDCLNVCPGQNPDTPGSEEMLFGRCRSEEERWLGIFGGQYGGRAIDREIFELSASGGSATALLAAAMETFAPANALVMGRDSKDPKRSAGIIVDSEASLQNSCQSTYQLAPYLAPLREAYESSPDINIVASGIACQVQAIRKLQRQNTPIGEWARSRICFVVEIACSSNTLPQGTVSLIEEESSINLSDVIEVKYRSGSYPGNIRIRGTNGAEEEVLFWKAVEHFKKHKTFRCLSCGDWMSGLADISVCDGDPNIFAGSKSGNDIEKHGRILVRTDLGRRILEYAASERYLKIWDTDLGGFNLGLERKRHRRAHYERSGTSIPEGPIPNFKDDVEILLDEEILRRNG